MLSSSHPKIHEPPAIGVSRDTRTGDSTRNCERRAVDERNRRRRGPGDFRNGDEVVVQGGLAARGGDAETPYRLESTGRLVIARRCCRTGRSGSEGVPASSGGEARRYPVRGGTGCGGHDEPGPG